MTIDPAKGAEIEKIVRGVYERAVGERELDETDRELLEVAINQQVILCFIDGMSTNKCLLSERGRAVFSNASLHLDQALFVLNLENPYRRRKPN